MIAATPPSLAELGELSPGLRSVFERYRGTAMLCASSQELQRFRRHVLEACRIDPCDLALFDHFPADDRQAITRALHVLVHDRMRQRQEEHARRLAAQAPVEALRRQLLSEADRNRLIDLGIWAHMLLGDAEIAERLVDRFFDLTTVERVRAFAANRELVIDAFEAAVRRQCMERRARRQSRSRLDAPATAELTLAYTSLGLSADASPATVCQAYRTLAKRHHPDLGGDEGRMKEVNQAYSRIAATWR